MSRATGATPKRYAKRPRLGPRPDIFYLCKKALEDIQEKLKNKETITPEAMELLVCPEIMAPDELMVPVDFSFACADGDWDDFDTMLARLGPQKAAEACAMARDLFEVAPPEREYWPPCLRRHAAAAAPMTAAEWRRILEESSDEQQQEEEEEEDDIEGAEEEEGIEDDLEPAHGGAAEEGIEDDLEPAHGGAGEEGIEDDLEPAHGGAEEEGIEDDLEPAHGGAGPANGGARPAYGGVRPAAGGAGPACGGAEPAAGGAGPAHGGAIPADGGAATQANGGDEVLLPLAKKARTVCGNSDKHRAEPGRRGCSKQMTPASNPNSNVKKYMGCTPVEHCGN